MRKTMLLVTVMLAALVLAGGAALSQTPPPGGEAEDVPPGALPGAGVVPGEYVVVLEEGATDEDGEEGPGEVAAEDEEEHPGLEVEKVYSEAIEGYAAEIPPGEVEDVEDDPGVLFVAENRVFRQPESNQPARKRSKSTQVLPTGTDRVQGDRSSTKSGNGRGTVGNVGIAVFDAGVDPEHPDLNVAGGVDCNPTTDGYDDRNGHGTGVAGVAAAKDDDIGVVGIAPGAPIYSVKVLDDEGYGDLAQVICGVDWVTANADKIGVANLSLAETENVSDDGNCGLSNEDAFHLAICRSVEAGVTYVVSAGNDGVDFSTVVPAAYDEVLTVTAITDFDGRPGGKSGPRDGEGGCQSVYYELGARDDRAVFFSNFATAGSPDARHTVAAPGVCLSSDFPGGRYSVYSGTSFSAPVVAGTAALYKSRNPDATPRQVRDRLIADARARPESYGFKGDPRRPIGDRYYGYLVHAGGY